MPMPMKLQLINFLRGTQPNAVKTFKSTTMGQIKVGAFGVMYDLKDSSKGMKWTDPIIAAKEQVKYFREVEKLTNFTVTEFNILSSIVEPIANARWLNGRGKRPSTAPKDLMMVFVMKHACLFYILGLHC